MLFNQPVTELIRQRYSCRAYQKSPIASEQAVQLQAFLKTVQSGPFGTPMRFELVIASDSDQDALKGLGTYNAIQDPAGFIIGASQPGERQLEDYGYALETIILYATGLGLATCWLGGNFTRSTFSKKVHATRKEIVPGVASIGYPAAGIRTRDLQRIKVKSDTRLPWDELFFKYGIAGSLSREGAGEYALALDMLRLAPSAHNYQPWRVVQDDSCYHFYLKRTPGFGPRSLAFILLDVVDLQRMEIGIAMCHFELTAREFGLDGGWEARPPSLAYPGVTAEYVATWVGA
jgi:hypothetical protein